MLRGAQIQTNSNKNRKSIKKPENRKKPIFFYVFGCPFIKTASSDQISD
jgi:hypothetical protein